MIRTIFNGLNHYKVSADFNSYRLSPLAPHRVRFAPQNRLLEPADCMKVSYDKLWAILNERGIMKTELVRAAKISTNAMAKLGKNEDVRLGILVNICKTLDCKLDDIVEMLDE